MRPRELATILLGADVLLGRSADDEFFGPGTICNVWLIQAGPDPATMPCYSVLMETGAIASLVAPQRVRVVSVEQRPAKSMVNRTGGE